MGKHRINHIIAFTDLIRLYKAPSDLVFNKHSTFFYSGMKDAEDIWCEHRTIFSIFTMKGVGVLQSEHALRPPEASFSVHRFHADALGIREWRRCLAFVQRCTIKGLSRDKTSGKFAIVRLIDGGQVDEQIDGYDETSPLKLCEPGAGFSIFQRTILAEIDDWARNWLLVLENLDEKFAFQVPHAHHIFDSLFLLDPQALLIKICYAFSDVGYTAHEFERQAHV